MVRRVIVFVAVVLVMGLSLLAIQWNPDSNKLLKEQQFGKTEQSELPKEGLQGFDKQLKLPAKEGLQGIDKQSKMPLKRFY